jgi:pantothenate kinase
MSTPSRSDTVGPRVTWEPEVAAAILERLSADPLKYATRPFMVALVGIPGSGKTTGTAILRGLVPDSIVIPVDGFHHYSSQLQAREDAEAAVYRRGE